MFTHLQACDPSEAVSVSILSPQKDNSNSCLSKTSIKTSILGRKKMIFNNFCFSETDVIYVKGRGFSKRVEHSLFVSDIKQFFEF